MNSNCHLEHACIAANINKTLKRVSRHFRLKYILFWHFDLSWKVLPKFYSKRSAVGPRVELKLFSHSHVWLTLQIELIRNFQSMIEDFILFNLCFFSLLRVLENYFQHERKLLDKMVKTHIGSDPVPHSKETSFNATRFCTSKWALQRANKVGHS